MIVILTGCGEALHSNVFKMAVKSSKNRTAVKYARFSSSALKIVQEDATSSDWVVLIKISQSI